MVLAGVTSFAAGINEDAKDIRGFHLLSKSIWEEANRLAFSDIFYFLNSPCYLES
jgi:hypothetical protein